MTNTAATAVARNNNNGRAEKKWLLRFANILRILLWPLRRISHFLFPPSDFDGLSPAVTAKAATQFRNYLKDLQMQQAKRTKSSKSNNNNNNTTPVAAATTAAALTELWHAAGFQALRDQAAQNQSLLLLYLHSPLHRQADAMARTVLCHPTMMQFLADSHVMAMGCSVHTAQGAALQDSLQCSALPCLVVLQPDTSRTSSSSSSNSSSSAMQLLFRAQGPALLEMVQLEKTQQPQPPNRRSASNTHNNTTTTTATTAAAAAAAVEQQLVPVLRSVLQRHQAVLAEQTARRLQREQEMELRRQQDEEYQATLLADQERERQRQAELEQERAAERAKEEAAAEAQLKLVQMQSLVRPEPAAEQKTGVAMIRLVLPTGQKVNRKFYADDTIGVVKAFVYLHCQEQEGMENIGLSTNFPRKTYEDDDLTLQDAGLVPQAVLMVQDLDA